MNMDPKNWVKSNSVMWWTIFRYNITLQDLKVANKLWTNEGLWPGRLLRIPIVEVSIVVGTVQ